MISGSKLIGGDPRATTQYLSDEQWRKIEPLLPLKSLDPREADPLPPTGKFWRVSSGSCEQEHPGKICHQNIPVHLPAGVASNAGQKKMCGCRCGELSSPSLTQMVSWIGRRPSLTPASPRRKKGLPRRENQKGERLEVAGGGRRPGYSSGRHHCLGLAGGSNPGRRSPGDDQGSSSRSRSSQDQTQKTDGGQGLRFGQIAFQACW